MGLRQESPTLGFVPPRDTRGTARRSTSIWVSPELSVVSVSYPSNALVLSDYAAVLADVRVVEKLVVRRPM
jgi:hypothetical protein